ncbi:hypothetical protein JX265_000145 [Neoarthrinium moseri]|uniref:SET domain-containing protein n=1 Tax=Neoarthrinium moseri TaxID=1658444 RepID=A0A9P9WXV7_9PEZI|nr:uncharacterized protein JN550_001155 [Neoarthrinium moseri]KAI1853359.1 hypothetical protein JX266_002065 [Neoarthrinium moseri]KAI1877083.1 hypothetical protein JN550_001155 [Neoarthrinium moseri]KAI1881319.1 hypothetical protein JX265_000145 [Neoarthrinium moseri]
MTEKLHSLSTHIVPPSQTTVTSPKPVPVLLNHASSKAETVDEEPYTIKCICPFADDDGNTIYCETCDTWQHIECYYPHNVQDALQEDFAHSCVDCKPRLLDRHLAIERQQARRAKVKTAENLTERKPKRPPSKSHKKKTRPNDLQVNGHSGSDSNAKQAGEHHGHKKSKSTHRPSQSISGTAKRSPSYGQKTTNGTSHGHPPSPATTPPDIPTDVEIHNYSSSFLTLYNDDRDIQIVSTNSFAGLEISNVMSFWLRDHDRLQREAGCDYKDVFQQLPPNIDSIKRTPVISHKEHLMAPDTVLHWQYLTTPQSIEKDTPLVELNGQLGFQKDYCADEANRWAELSSPLPFVFFHPELPLYIDTRREGSLARYVRRSCRPNATIDTYLSEGSEYHFWLVSDRRIAPNEQVTIPWDFRFENGERGMKTRQLLGIGVGEMSELPDYDPTQIEQYEGLRTWLSLILSEHGGCACDLGSDCAFRRFYRKYINRSHSKSGAVKKKSRKPKPHAISPTSTGHATNSRAPSEGHGDDVLDNDSGSSHSKPPSRDMTPAPRQGSFDTLGILTEPTDRDKRKVAMVEDSFRRMEQQQPPRKKKRTSDGTVVSKGKRNSSGSAAGLTNGLGERRYVDASTNRSMSGSPQSAIAPNSANHFRAPGSRHGSMPIPSRHSSEGPRPVYCDAAVQTDAVEGEWFSSARSTPRAKRRVVSLSKRLLENRHRLRADLEERRRLSTASPTSVVSALVKMDLDSPKVQNDRLQSPVTSKDNLGATTVKTDSSGDAVMLDVPMASPTDSKTASPTETASSPNVAVKSPELRVQLPPVPTFNSTASVSAATTPMSATGTIVQSPYSSGNLPSPFGASVTTNGVAVHPSPVKKKLSLSDYKSRLSKAAAAKPVGATLKQPVPISEEAKSPTVTDVPMSDSPNAEKTAEQ